MKKLAVAFLALALVLTTVLVPIIADGDTVTTVGYSSQRVKKADLSQVTDIKDYDKGVFQFAYKITDKEGFLKFAELVNGGETFRKTYIYLANDIDMTGVTDFKPIGQMAFTVISRSGDKDKVEPGQYGTISMVTKDPDSDTYFSGIFNGHGHIIDNLNMTVSGEEVLYAGLFGYVRNAEISNLIIGENCSFTYNTANNYGGIGALVGLAEGSTIIDNVYNLADVNGGAFDKYVAGDTKVSFAVHASAILARGCATITNCTNTGAIEGCLSAGSMIAYTEGGECTVTNCRNTGTIKAAKVGGLVARRNVPVQIANCINNGDVYGTTYSAAGFLGYLETWGGPSSVKNSINYGTIGCVEGFSDKCKTDAIAYNPGTEAAGHKNLTIDACEDKAGQEEDPTLETDLETPVFRDAVDADGTETAFTTYETTVSTQEYVIPVNPNPSTDDIGFSSARIRDVDTSNIYNIKNFKDRPDEDEYKITDIQGWYYLDTLLYDWNLFAGVTIYLANDLDFENKEGYEPISYDKENYLGIGDQAMFFFAGTLDGLGHQICNLKMKETYGGTSTREDGSAVKNPIAFVGLFGATSEATFKNLVIAETCEFKLVSKAAYPIGGALTAWAETSITIENCWNRANVTGARQGGGFCGRTGTLATYEINNSTNSGYVEASYNAGGAIGYTEGAGLIYNSRNVGDVKCTATSADQAMCSAGFIARAWKVIDFEKCINNGDILGAANCGAFAGTIHAKTTLKNCQNYGLLFEDLEIGNVGLVGCIKDGTKGEILLDKDCANLYGQVDESLKYEELIPDFTPEESPDPNQAPSTNPPTQQTTAAPTPGGTDATDATTDATKATTKAPADDDDEDEDDEDEGGCSSTVIGGFAVIALISGAALTLFKKKED